MKSWKTTTAGVLAIVAAIATALAASFDSDPLTVAHWDIVIAATLAGIGLIFARDNTVTSETAGAK